MIVKYPQLPKKQLRELKIGDTFLFAGALCMRVIKYEDFENHDTLEYVVLSNGEVRTMPGSVHVIPCDCEIQVK